MAPGDCWKEDSFGDESLRFFEKLAGHSLWYNWHHKKGEKSATGAVPFDIDDHIDEECEPLCRGRFAAHACAKVHWVDDGLQDRRRTGRTREFLEDAKMVGRFDLLIDARVRMAMPRRRRKTRYNSFDHILMALDREKPSKES